MQNSMTTQRIRSIDAFRGITILVMIFVNELAGVANIPAWMKHMPADADAMTFVDVVFPAFLFIVGMSIPFAINNRMLKGDDNWQIQKHILIRTMGLLVLGVFMVNAEGESNEAAMPISIHLWSLLFYACVIMVWNAYKASHKTMVRTLRAIGIMGLIILAFLYRGGEDGNEYMKPHWWGILGLIGWSYLVASMLYQITRGKILFLVSLVAVCVAYYALGRNTDVRASAFSPLFSQGGHASHISITLCGVVLSMIFFAKEGDGTKKFIQAGVFVVALFVAGFLLRPYYHISKIYATPTWSLYSAAYCCLIFCFLYWLVDLKNINRWTNFFRPAAANPLLTYIIPFITYELLALLHVHLPGIFQSGVMGMIWSAGYAVAVMAVVIGLNKLSIKLQL